MSILITRCVSFVWLSVLLSLCKLFTFSICKHLQHQGLQLHRLMICVSLGGVLSFEVDTVVSIASRFLSSSLISKCILNSKLLKKFDFKKLKILFFNSEIFIYVCFSNHDCFFFFISNAFFISLRLGERVLMAQGLQKANNTQIPAFDEKISQNPL